MQVVDLDSMEAMMRHNDYKHDKSAAGLQPSPLRHHADPQRGRERGRFDSQKAPPHCRAVCTTAGTTKSRSEEPVMGGEIRMVISAA